MYMLDFLRDFFKGFVSDFATYVRVYMEEIFGISVGSITFANLRIGNELFHSFMSVVTAVLSAYIIHRLKKYWTIKKKNK